MYATDFDRTKANSCELCPALVVNGQPSLVCAGCNNKKVHVYCATYVLGSVKAVDWWSCSNCRDGRPKRPADPNISLRMGSTRTRKAPDTYQVEEIRPTRKRTTPPLLIPSLSSDTTYTKPDEALSSDQPYGTTEPPMGIEGSSNGGQNLSSIQKKRSRSLSEATKTIILPAGPTGSNISLYSPIQSSGDGGRVLTRSRRRVGTDSGQSQEQLGELE